MPRDTFESAYECEDCGRSWGSLSAVMQCPCDKLTPYGYPREGATENHPGASEEPPGVLMERHPLPLETTPGAHRTPGGIDPTPTDDPRGNPC